MADQPPLIALGQVESVRDPEENLEKARGVVAKAADRGADLVVFPEYLMSWGSGSHNRSSMSEVAQPLDGTFVSGLSEAATEAGVWIVAGIIESNPSGDRPYNTTVVLDQGGRLRGSYRKSHLFDAFSYRESAGFRAGDKLFTPIESPVGCLGLFVCYELRFPEVARHAADNGANLLIVPSAWVAGPLKDLHWRTLITARATENGCFVAAAAQVGNEFSGQSLVVDPMGVSVAEGTERECVVYAELDPNRVAEVRQEVPSLRHRRPELYKPT